MLDVRPAPEYAAGHIPGALSVPVDELPERLDELPVGREVVAYCRGAYCVFAHDAVRILRARGRSACRLQGEDEDHLERAHGDQPGARLGALAVAARSRSVWSSSGSPLSAPA